MFWKNTLRVSDACKGVLDCMWIESRIEIASNRGVCLGVVTAMTGVVHRPGLSVDWLAMTESSNFGWSPDTVVCTAMSVTVHRRWLSGAAATF